MSPAERRQAMEARATGARDYWTNYLTFRADATQDRDEALSRIEQQERVGSLSPQAAVAARRAIEDDYQSQLSTIEQGPTRQLLESEFQAQREEALDLFTSEENRRRTQYERSPQPFQLTYRPDDYRGQPITTEAIWNPGVQGRGADDLGGGYYTVRDGDEVRELRNITIESAVELNPFQAREFEFASTADEFFGTMFGTEGAPSAEGRGYRPEATTRRTGGSNQSAIGVGQIYRWY